MILETKSRSYLAKLSRAVLISYFTIKNSVDNGDMTIIHCPTVEIVVDYFAKPLQGSRFLKFNFHFRGRISEHLRQIVVVS